MTDLPTDDHKFQTYLDYNDNNSEFEGISEQESDVDIPNILESSDDEGENESNDEEIDDEVELSANFHNHKLIQYFNEDIGPQFPDGFDTIIASAKDYFDLLFDANIMTNFVIDIQTIMQSAKSNNQGEVDSVFTQVKPICDLLCCVRENNFCCIGQASFHL